jgi:putative PIN family toxin of toxin-antitoxin system
VVLDTTVLIAALRSDRGASRVLLEKALYGEFTLLASVPLMLEYEAVATRTEHQAAGLSEGDVEAVLDALATVIEPVRLAFHWRPMLPDGDDDMVLETAVNGHADILVTVNRRDFAPAVGTFCVKVVSPADAVRRLRRTR